MSTSGRMKTSAFHPSAPRKVGHDVRAFREARTEKYPGLGEQGGVLAQAIGASFWLQELWAY
jgi:hypothetical protein